MATGEGRDVRYRFGPLHRRGLVAGLRSGQIAAMASGLVVAVGVLRARPSVLGAVIALVAVCMGVAFATWPIGGRTPEEWAPDVVRHITSSGRMHRAGLDIFRGVRLVSVDIDEFGRGDGRGEMRGDMHGDMHDDMHGDASPDDHHNGARVRRPFRAAVLCDRTRRTFTAVCRVSAPGFVLLSEEDKATRVGAWAAVLASVARQGSSVHRIQWLERVAPGRDDTPRRRLESVGRRQPHDEARGSYEALVDAESHNGSCHEVLMAVTVHAGHAGRAIRTAGGGDAGACALVLREMAAFRRRLDDASFEAGPVLGPGELVDVLRRGYGNPSAHVARDRWSAARRSGAERADPAAWPWPMGIGTEWSRLRADDTWHATFWIAEWPRIDVPPDFLGPLLLSSEVRRTMSVVMEPTGPVQASRRVEQARTADIADAELRRRGGFLATARRRREEEVLADREVEIADGHAHYRFSGYVTVSASSSDELEDACARVEQAAGHAGLALRRCYGDQASAFLCTLPLGRGLF